MPDAHFLQASKMDPLQCVECGAQTKHENPFTRLPECKPCVKAKCENVVAVRNRGFLFEDEIAALPKMRVGATQTFVQKKDVDALMTAAYGDPMRRHVHKLEGNKVGAITVARAVFGLTPEDIAPLRAFVNAKGDRLLRIQEVVDAAVPRVERAWVHDDVPFPEGFVRLFLRWAPHDVVREITQSAHRRAGVDMVRVHHRIARYALVLDACPELVRQRPDVAVTWCLGEPTRRPSANMFSIMQTLCGSEGAVVALNRMTAGAV